MADKKYRYFSFLISPELEDALKAAAIAKERSASWIVKKAITEYLKADVAGVAVKRRGNNVSQ